jgi:hypothetical protein
MAEGKLTEASFHSYMTAAGNGKRNTRSCNYSLEVPDDER